MTGQEFLKNDNFVVGQYVSLDNDEEKYWRGAYVSDVFDDHIIIRHLGGTYKYDFDEVAERQDYAVYVPTRNGRKVMAKKNIFGKYTFKPRKY